jgi:hypothetical protein
MKLTPGMLVERTYGEGQRPIGIIISPSRMSRPDRDGSATHWIVMWTSGKRDIIAKRYLTPVT